MVQIPQPKRREPPARADDAASSGVEAAAGDGSARLNMRRGTLARDSAESDAERAMREPDEIFASLDIEEAVED